MLTSINILGYDLDTPLQFNVPLDFTEDDLNSYPWLASKTRWYQPVEVLGSGGMSIAFLCRPCDEHGNEIADIQLVLKTPNLSERFDSEEIEDRLKEIKKHTLDEWTLVRTRLANCKFANPIIDFGTIWIKHNNKPMELWATVQPFLDAAVSLDEFLVDKHLRSKIVKSNSGVEVDNWTGVPHHMDFIRLARMLAEGLAEIHKRRVVHGDIWPPNVYVNVSDPSNPHVVFIDFGEAFGTVPTGQARTQPNHAYRAPERGAKDSAVTEQADVYSFGKLLLWLVIGIREVIPPDHLGHARREFVRRLILKRNPSLIKDNPHIMDWIMRCVQYDPVSRPRSIDLLAEFTSFSARREDNTPTKSSLAAKFQGLMERLETRIRDDDPLASLIELKIDELSVLVNSLDTEMVDLVDTRDRLIAALERLFDTLHTGDRFISLTSPGVWHENALGLDGRYATATLEALRRGASVQRAFAFSIEECGLEWSEQFQKALEYLGTDPAHRLASALESACWDYRSFLRGNDELKLKPEVTQAAQKRLRLVINSARQMIDTWLGGTLLWKGEFTDVLGVEGLYLGLIARGTLKEVRELKARHPVSLIYRHDAVGEHDRWLLMMTDLRGRNEYGLGSGPSLTHLRGVRVYRSVLGTPNDRKMQLDTLFKKEAINVASWITQLDEVLASCEDSQF